MKFTDEQIAQMADGYPPQEYDCNEVIAAMSEEIAELRECLKEACAAVCSGVLVGCKGIFAYDSKCCLLAECEYHKWRKALEGVK